MKAIALACLFLLAPAVAFAHDGFGRQRIVVRGFNGGHHHGGNVAFVAPFRQHFHGGNAFTLGLGSYGGYSSGLSLGLGYGGLGYSALGLGGGCGSAAFYAPQAYYTPPAAFSGGYAPQAYNGDTEALRRDVEALRRDIAELRQALTAPK